MPAVLFLLSWLSIDGENPVSFKLPKLQAKECWWAAIITANRYKSHEKRISRTHKHLNLGETSKRLNYSFTAVIDHKECCYAENITKMSDMGKLCRIPAKHNVMIWTTFVYVHSIDIMRKRCIYKNKMRDNHKEKGQVFFGGSKLLNLPSLSLDSHTVSNMTHQPLRSITHWCRFKYNLYPT